MSKNKLSDGSFDVSYFFVAHILSKLHGKVSKKLFLHYIQPFLWFKPLKKGSKWPGISKKLDFREWG